MVSLNVSQLFHTVVAHKFLSWIVIQISQSELNEISQSVEFQNIHQASILVQYNLVQEDVGTVGEFLKQRTEKPPARLLLFWGERVVELKNRM